MIPNLTNFNKCIACGIALASLALGAVITNRRTHASEVRAAGDRIFELRIYHAVPGKLPVMESRFRAKTSKILARHNLNVIGYWVAEKSPDNSFVFLFSHESREAAKKNWEPFHVDPEFDEVAKSAHDEKTL